MSWRKKMAKQKELKMEGAGLTFERVLLLSECYEDEEYLDDCHARDVNAIDELDSELSDVGYGFLELLACTKHATKEEWKVKGIKKVMAEVLSQQQGKRKDAVERFSWKDEYNKLLAKVEILQEENAKLIQALRREATAA